MEISALTDDGGFQGEYLTRVTLAGSCPRVSPLKGAQQQPSEVASPTFAFTVRWDMFSSKCWGTRAGTMSCSSWTCSPPGSLPGEKGGLWGTPAKGGTDRVPPPSHLTASPQMPPPPSLGSASWRRAGGRC